MVLTFLNLVVVSGILVGLIQGSINAQRNGYIGDVGIIPLGDRTSIENSESLIELARMQPEVKQVVGRYVVTGSVESNYNLVTDPNNRQLAAGTVIGLDVAHEMSDMGKYIKEGEMLKADDYDQVILGANLLTKYLNFKIPGFKTIDDVGPGTKVRVRVGGATRDVIVKGIVKRKVDNIDRSIIMTAQQFKDMTGITDHAVISIVLNDRTKAPQVRDELISSGAGRYGDIRTFDEAIPKAVLDIRDTFSILGNLFSAIGLIVAIITVFIVIFINALTRRKFIGIMKGIGVSGRTIEMSYVFQSMFYATIGSAIGLAVLYGFLSPYLAQHPINFPFSDGILVADPVGTFERVGVLILCTFIAGYIPAWMIVRRNTLDAILGR